MIAQCRTHPKQSRIETLDLEFQLSGHTCLSESGVFDLKLVRSSLPPEVGAAKTSGIRGCRKPCTGRCTAILRGEGGWKLDLRPGQDVARPRQTTAG